LSLNALAPWVSDFPGGGSTIPLWEELISSKWQQKNAEHRGYHGSLLPFIVFEYNLRTVEVITALQKP
jgi:hypothetical protein